jgi:putative transposase
VQIVRADQVWSADITYVRLRAGFLYLVAILDWQSRYVLSWSLSAGPGGAFCLWALEEALLAGRRPEIFNTDQGVQFTAEAFTGALAAEGIAISMNGRGRCHDNIFVERLWRTVKYEEVYLKDYADVVGARRELRAHFRFYNQERPHQALQYRTPAEAYFAGQSAGRRKGSAASQAVAGTPVALRAPSVPATAGPEDSLIPGDFWS